MPNAESRCNQLKLGHPHLNDDLSGSPLTAIPDGVTKPAPKRKCSDESTKKLLNLLRHRGEVLCHRSAQIQSLLNDQRNGSGMRDIPGSAL